MHSLLDYTQKVVYGAYLRTIWAKLVLQLMRDMPDSRGDEWRQGEVGCCQATFENVVPTWIFCFQKWNHLVSYDVNSTTFTVQCQSFPIKTLVSIKPKSRNFELGHDSPRKPRLLEFASYECITSRSRTEKNRAKIRAFSKIKAENRHVK